MEAKEFRYERQDTPEKFGIKVTTPTGTVCNFTWPKYDMGYLQSSGNDASEIKMAIAKMLGKDSLSFPDKDLASFLVSQAG
jgi:hypothetical protein